MMLWTQGIRGCMNIDGDLDNTVSSGGKEERNHDPCTQTYHVPQSLNCDVTGDPSVKFFNFI